MNAVVYYRVSTKKQEASGLGLEAQHAAVTAYLASAQGEAVASYTEIESGKKCDRRELRNAIAHAKRCGARLVVAKLDRLARNVLFTATLMDAGVDFVCCDNPFATRLTIHILAAVAEDEARRISERTKAALAAYVARGGSMNHGRPLTCESRSRGAATTNRIRREGRAHCYEDLREFFEIMNPHCTMAEMANVLNQRNHRTMTGHRWSRVSVKRALQLLGIKRPPLMGQDRYRPAIRTCGELLHKLEKRPFMRRYKDGWKVANYSIADEVAEQVIASGVVVRVDGEDIYVLKRR